MPKGERAGVVSELWRFPVKSMAGERLEAAEVTEQGVLGDRAYGLVDVETGKVVSAKSVRLFPGILSCHAAFVEPPRSGRVLREDDYRWELFPGNCGVSSLNFSIR